MGMCSSLPMSRFEVECKRKINVVWVNTSTPKNWMLLELKAMCQASSSQEDKTMLSVSSRGGWKQRMRRDWKSKREREEGAERIATEGVRCRDWESACAPESNPLNPHL